MKFFLLIIFLIPFNLSAEGSDLEIHGSWAYQYLIDDFTDEKTNIVQSKENSKFDKFEIIMKESTKTEFTWRLNIEFQGCKGTSDKYKEAIPVLFRVDKREVFTFYMHPRKKNYLGDIDRTKLILARDKNDDLEILYFYLDLQDGNELKIRVDDPICDYRHDTNFPLDGFTKAFAYMNSLVQRDIQTVLENKGLVEKK